MSALEELVRPFQRPQAISTGQRLPAVVVKISGGIVEARWGDVGALPQPKDTGFSLTLCNETMTETNRQTDSVKITNPNDSSQFIQVKRANTLTLQKSTNQAPVLNSDFNIGVEQDMSAFSTAGDFFQKQDGSSTDHCQVTMKLNNNTSQG